MFDTDKYDPKLQKEPSAAPAAAYEPVSNVKEMSLLAWGEHCIECAAPDCFQTCDLYDPRPDKRCRRFTFGAMKNRNFRSLHGYGVEISFKKWAKIEAFGNLTLVPVRTALRYERMIDWAAPVLNVVGSFMGRLTKNINWDNATYISLERFVRRLSQSKADNRSPDAFLLEVYNPTTETVRMQVNFRPVIDGESPNHNLVQLGASYITTVEFPSGYSRHEIQASHFRAIATSGGPFKISLTPEADNNARLVFLTADFVKYASKPAASTDAKQIKCVVWDLDNTLWNGILVEGDDVALRPGIAVLLKQLDERGILLSIASKNDFASAWQKLEQLGIDEYFLYPQINWAPKSMNVKTIAERLNIGIDTFAFVDDNPFELEQVSRTHPEVVCVNANDIAALASDPRFQGSTSADSKQRRHFYREAIAREQAQEEFGSNYIGFLATCGITLDLAPYSPEYLDRVAELVQRTNQLNFSGHKYTRAQLNEILDNSQLEKYVLKSSDKFGSYGTVGFCIVEHGTGLVQLRDFMLSCRVQGKFLEQAFFDHLMEHHNPDAARTLWVNFHETARNKPAQQVLEMLGFRKCSPATDRLLEGVVHNAPESLKCEFIRVNCSAASSEVVRGSLPLSEGIKPTEL